jgi:hypothetical protein
MRDFLGPARESPRAYWYKQDRLESPSEIVARDAGADVFMLPENLPRSEIDKFVTAFQHAGRDMDIVKGFVLDVTFVEDFKEFKITHALRALDYLYDLDLTRRQEIAKVMQRVDMTKDNFRSLTTDSAAGRKFLGRISELEREIEVDYAALHILIRFHASLNRHTLSFPLTNIAIDNAKASGK